jgi:hypothetical protein
MAAASRLERSGASFVSSFSAGATFSNSGFSVAEGFSVAGAFALTGDFSPLAAFVLDEDFSGLDAFAVVDGFSFVDFGFVETFPFAEADPLFDAVTLGDDAVFSVRSFAGAAETVAESAIDLGAVSGFTAGAHALAMTIAISGIRA